MAYTKVHEDWKNRPNFTTPITAEAMEHIESGIAAAHEMADSAVQLPPGGTDGQVLTKSGGALAWTDPPTGGGGGSLVEDPPGSGLFSPSSAGLTEDPANPGLYLI